jgi:hypothetical protein
MSQKHTFEAIYNFTKNECLRAAHEDMTPCLTLQNILDETKWSTSDKLIVVNIRYNIHAPPQYGYYIPQSYVILNGQMEPYSDPHPDLTPFYERNHMQRVLDEAIKRKGYTCKFYCIFTNAITHQRYTDEMYDKLQTEQK